MIPYGLEPILWPTSIIFFATILVSYKLTRYPALSIFSGFIKSGLFAIYYGFYFDGTYTFLDDWTYLEGGKELFSGEIGVTNILEHLDFVKEIGGGSHVLYYLINSYAFKAFGYGYYSPVALNILLTIAIAFFGARLASRGFGFDKKTSNIFYFFLLLYPDILAWSTIMNGKDILVLFFQIMLLVSIAEYWNGNRGKAILISTPVLFFCFF